MNITSIEDMNHLIIKGPPESGKYTILRIWLKSLVPSTVTDPPILTSLLKIPWPVIVEAAPTILPDNPFAVIIPVTFKSVAPSLVIVETPGLPRTARLFAEIYWVIAAPATPLKLEPSP